MNIKIKKRLTTFMLVIALMTGSVAQLAVLSYRAARMIAVSSLSFAADIAHLRGGNQSGLGRGKTISKQFDKALEGYSESNVN